MSLEDILCFKALSWINICVRDFALNILRLGDSQSILIQGMYVFRKVRHPYIRPEDGKKQKKSKYDHCSDEFSRDLFQQIAPGWLSTNWLLVFLFRTSIPAQTPRCLTSLAFALALSSATANDPLFACCPASSPAKTICRVHKTSRAHSFQLRTVLFWVSENCFILSPGIYKGQSTSFSA